MSNKVIIAVDAMGGENSPKKIIEGIKISLKLSQENFLVNEGKLIKLSNGVIIKRNSDLIIIEQLSKTIIINKIDSNQIIAFLED